MHSLIQRRFLKQPGLILAGLLLVLPINPVAALSAEPEPALSAEEVATSYVDLAMAELLKAGAQGVVIAIEASGRKTFTAVAGAAVRSGPSPLSISHGFQVGSQTKTFTAVAILMLQRMGKLHLDDPVTRFIVDLPGDEDISIRDLLMHRSGMGDGVRVLDELADLPSRTYTFADLLLLSKIDGRQFAPGEKFQYNNFGYDVLGQIITQVSGMPYQDFISKHILRPLEMRRTFSGSVMPWSDAMPMAHGYVYDKEDGSYLDAGQSRDLSWASSAGDMISSTGDMLIWAKSLNDAENPLGVTFADLLSERIATPPEGGLREYGLGVMVREFGGILTHGHGGSIHGYITYSGIVPQSDVAFSVMVSLADGPDFKKPAIFAELENLLRVALSTQAVLTAATGMTIR